MADDYNITYSFNLDDTPVPPAPAAEPQPAAVNTSADLYAFDECESLPIPSGVLLVSRNSGVRLALMQEVAIALQYCSNFKTLQQHAQHLVARIPELGGNVTDVVKVLEQVRDGGLLVSAAEMSRHITSDSSASTPAAPSMVFIISCDRPAAVARLLESMLQNAALSRHRGLCLVDDSRQPASCAANRDAVARFNLTSPLRMAYVGPDEQQQLVDELVQQLPDSERGIRFALSRQQWQGYATYGLARTVCTLLSVGSRCIVMDDDVLCAALKSPQQSPQQTTGVSFGEAAREASFYATPEQCLQSTEPADFDPLSGHASCLGLGLADALTKLGQTEFSALQLADASAGQFHGLGPDSYILMTQCGSFGDPGTVSNAWMANLTPASRDRMLSTAGGLAGALGIRQCWLGQPAPKIFRRAVMSQVTGLDNSRFLPPYFPVFRGEDQLFGTLLNVLHPSGLVLEYDWGVPHLPLESRQGNAAGDSSVPQATMHLVSSFLAECLPLGRAVPLQLRLQGLCQRLEELAASDDAAVIALFSGKLARAQALNLQQLNDQLQQSGQSSPQWNAYLQQCLQENNQALQRPPSLTDIPGLQAGMSAGDVTAHIRQLAQGYADSLRAWPAVREVASTLAERYLGAT